MKLYEAKEEEIGADTFREAERVFLLRAVDRRWMDHIDAMDQLKQGIGLRSYGQQDPVRAYNNEGFAMFEEMNAGIKDDTLKSLYNVVLRQPVERVKVAKETSDNQGNEPVVKKQKVGRNDPCPCGSGKKYKKCCGKNE